MITKPAVRSFRRQSRPSVFVGARRNSSPAALLLLRAGHSERTMAEHKASSAEAVAPLFSPDSQRIYFKGDRLANPPSTACTSKTSQKTDAA
jgi:oligogalacturonide lyase